MPLTIKQVMEMRQRVEAMREKIGHSMDCEGHEAIARAEADLYKAVLWSIAHAKPRGGREAIARCRELAAAAICGSRKQQRAGNAANRIAREAKNDRESKVQARLKDVLSRLARLELSVARTAAGLAELNADVMKRRGAP